MSRFLVIGAGGQVGEKIGQLAQAKSHHVIGAYKSRAPETQFSETLVLDKTKKDDVERAVSKYQPDVVIDTAALHNVDYCESHPDEAMAVNRDGTANLALAATSVRAKFIFVSTDFIFDGVGAPYTEESEPRPLSMYGMSKVEGEKKTLSIGKDNAAVCRPAVIYSWVKSTRSASGSSSGKPLNFGAWLASQLQSKKEVKIVTDQITSPTLADDLAAAIVVIAEKRSASGIFHTAGATALSRYDFSIKLAEKMGYDKTLIHPIDSSQLKQVAKRPLNSSLLSERIKRVVGYSMMDINQSLEKFASQAASDKN